MENNRFCQSCSMPITDPEQLGTEEDGSPASDYCRYCYRLGKYVNPDMTLEEMRSWITKRMETEDIPEDIIEAAVVRLATLKRWKTTTNEKSVDTTMLS